MSKRYGISLNDNLADKVEKIAESKDLTIQEFIRELLRAYVVAWERKKS